MAESKFHLMTGLKRPMYWVLGRTEEHPGQVVELVGGLTVSVEQGFGSNVFGLASVNVNVRGGVLAVHDNDILAALVERVVRGGGKS